jgi:hypothetical protein
MRLTNHFHVESRLRMTGIIPPLSNIPSWHVQGHLYITFTDLCFVAQSFLYLYNTRFKENVGSLIQAYS